VAHDLDQLLMMLLTWLLLGAGSDDLDQRGDGAVALCPACGAVNLINDYQVGLARAQDLHVPGSKRRSKDLLLMTVLYGLCMHCRLAPGGKLWKRVLGSPAAFFTHVTQAPILHSYAHGHPAFLGEPMYTRAPSLLG